MSQAFTVVAVLCYPVLACPQIECYNPAKMEHTLVYDDGDISEVDMTKRGFHVVGRVQRRQSPSVNSTKADAGATITIVTAAGGDVSKGLRTAQAEPEPLPEQRRPSTLGPRPPAQYAVETASAYVIAAVNRFGKAGGMAPLAQRLGGGSAPFTEILETLRLGKALWAHASSRGIKEVNWTLKECAPAALLSAPPESMRAATKAEIAECVSSVRELALTSSVPRGAPPPPLLLQELEQLELGLAMKVNGDFRSRWYDLSQTSATCLKFGVSSGRVVCMLLC